MQYSIPCSNLEKLIKKLNHIRNKGAEVSLSYDKENVKYERLTTGEYYSYYDVEVSGEYKINNWQFIATLDHTSNGNIIRKITNDVLPERFKDCAPYCEHCNTSRRRKDTYVIKNLITGEFKQVGKQCLMEYTSGLSADVCAALASVVRICEEAEEFDLIDNSNMTVLSSDEVKKAAYVNVKESGYIKDVTVRSILDNFRALADSCPENALQEVDEWVSTLNINSEYLRNASLAWKKDYIEKRDLALIASFINVFFREKQKRLEQQINSTNTYAGNIGDKVSFKVAAIKALYTKFGAMFAYNADDAVVYRIVDTTGKIYIWSTAKTIQENDIISAKIKNLSEYKGEKQTTITRGTIVRA